MNSETLKPDVSELPDEEVLADLAARREELRIVIHDLEVSKPATVLSLVALQISLLLLLAAIAFVVAPYFQPEFPRPISTLAAFLVVIFAFASYSAFRRFLAEYERLRLHRSVVERALYVSKMADDLLKTFQDNESSSKVS
jgi:hypothetical protein